MYAQDPESCNSINDQLPSAFGLQRLVNGDFANVRLMRVSSVVSCGMIWERRTLQH